MADKILGNIFEEILSLSPSKRTELTYFSQPYSESPSVGEGGEIEAGDISGRKLGSLGLPSLSLPKIEGLKRDKSVKTKKEEEAKSTDETATTDNQKGGVDFNFPDVNINAPSIGAEIEGVELPKFNMELPEGELTIPDIQPLFPDVDLRLDNEAGDVFKPPVEFVKEVGQKVLDGSRTVAELINEATEPTRKAIEDSVSEAAAILGDTVENVTRDSLIRQGDGSGYGEISIGGENSGLVIDVGTKIDNIYGDITQGTQLQGTVGRDIFDAATDPTKLVKSKGKEAAKSVLVDGLKMEDGLAGDVVDILENPEQALRDKGTKFVEDMARDSITKIAGEGAAKIGGEAIGGAVSAILDGKDAGQVAAKVAEGVARRAATEATLGTVEAVGNAIFPAAGTVVKVIANLLQYSCYLATAAYVGGHIDKYEFLQFYRYRTDYQADEWMGDEVRIGYLLFFSKIFDYQVDHPRFNDFISKHVTIHWLNYIKYKQGKRRFSLRGWIVTGTIRIISLVSYATAKDEERAKLSKLLGSLNILNVYKKTINAVEGRA